MSTSSPHKSLSSPRSTVGVRELNTVGWGQGRNDPPMERGRPSISPAPRRLGWDDRGCRFGAYRAARQLETACLPHPSSLLRSVSTLPPPPPFPTPSPPPPGLPFPSTSAAAGSRRASPPPPVRPPNRRIPSGFLVVAASAAREVPHGAPRHPPSFSEVIFLELSLSSNFLWQLFW